ncbi:MAG: DUF6062 family protein [Chloroflexi bacterium]|nr:DUF6062 family protein [Chloroflexota bacterium]
MAFALSITHLQDSLKKPGCPACRQYRETAEHAMESFLWENVNDPEARGEIMAAYGFCPEHTRLFVAAELSNSGIVLGVNIVYEHLGRLVSQELQDLAGHNWTPGGMGNLLASLGFKGKVSYPATILMPKGQCPICETAEKGALESLATLFEELEQGSQELLDAYRSSEGLCLAHLRIATGHFSNRHPRAAKVIFTDTIERLNRQSELMKEYIRKNNWAYRDEKLTQDEANAWRKALAFFTGYPGSLFTNQVEKY